MSSEGYYTCGGDEGEGEGVDGVVLHEDHTMSYSLPRSQHEEEHQRVAFGSPSQPRSAPDFRASEFDLSASGQFSPLTPESLQRHRQRVESSSPGMVIVDDHQRVSLDDPPFSSSLAHGSYGGAALFPASGSMAVVDDHNVKMTVDTSPSRQMASSPELSLAFPIKEEAGEEEDVRGHSVPLPLALLPEDDTEEDGREHSVPLPLALLPEDDKVEEDNNANTAFQAPAGSYVARAPSPLPNIGAVQLGNDANERLIASVKSRGPRVEQVLYIGAINRYADMLVASVGEEYRQQVLFALEVVMFRFTKSVRSAAIRLFLSHISREERDLLAPANAKHLLQRLRREYSVNSGAANQFVVPMLHRVLQTTTSQRETEALERTMDAIVQRGVARGLSPKDARRTREYEQASQAWSVRLRGNPLSRQLMLAESPQDFEHTLHNQSSASLRAIVNGLRLQGDPTASPPSIDLDMLVRGLLSDVPPPRSDLVAETARNMV